MAKKRVYEIAKEHGIASKDLLAKLAGIGVEVKSASSSVEETTALVAIGKPQDDGKAKPASGKSGDSKPQTAAAEKSGSKKDAPKKGEENSSPAPSSGQNQSSSNSQDQAARPAAQRSQGQGGRRRVIIDAQASRRPQTGQAPTQQQAAQQQQRRQGGRKTSRRRRMAMALEEDQSEQTTDLQEEEATVPAIQVNSGSTVKDVAEYLGIAVPEVIKKLMSLGEMATLTQTLSDEAIQVLAEEFDKPVEVIHVSEQQEAVPEFEDSESDLAVRPPVVTIMGHVDHGKTSLLDAIREAEVVAGEAGGITQHIGAYQVHHNEKLITFLDTPGHEAFTAMRARGARVTDIAVIVVAADDGVKPQTEEAIDHAKAAQVPIVVAVNKIDKEGAQPENVRTQLVAHGLQPEDWGGETVFVDVSAKTKQGLDTLLDMLLLVAEVEELRANPGVEASGVVIESKLDPGRGPVVTVLVQRGTLSVGDALVAGAHWGRVRAMHDFIGGKLKAAVPGDPVEVLGFDSVPEAGEFVRVLAHEREARRIARERANRVKMESIARRARRHVSLEDVFALAQQGRVKELNLILKADVAGSLGAIEDEIAKLPQDEVSVNVIHAAVGGINESDVMLAAASDAVVLGFNVRPIQDARPVANREGIEIRTYSVIYKAIDDLRAAMEGLLEPEEVEESLGHVEVRDIFRSSKAGSIAGCFVTEGKVTAGSKARLVRDGTVVYDGEIASLRRFKDDVREVANGLECGIVLKNFTDVKAGDEVEVYQTRQVVRELA